MRMGYHKLLIVFLNFTLKAEVELQMKYNKCYVFKTMNNDFCCGKSSLDQVWAETKELAIKLYRQQTGFTGKIYED